jgi:hypothetical protein
VAIVLAAVLLVGAACGGGIWALAHMPQASGIVTAPTAAPTATSQPTDTPQPLDTATPSVLYSDPMTTGALGWAAGNQCAAKGDGYHITGNWLCFGPTNVKMTNADVSVQTNELSGGIVPSFAIEFRGDSNFDNFYRFGINSGGQWQFGKAVNGADNYVDIVRLTPNGAIVSGHNAVNTMEVVAKGSHFDFYVNGTKVGQADDGTFGSGQIGLAANNGVEVVYTNFQMKPVS